MEAFIDAVHDVKCLWDVSDNGYKDQEMKDIYWAKIAKQCNMPHGTIAKKQWKKLRDCFREALKRQKEWKAGSIPADKKPWKYQKQMQFLVPYMKNRQKNSNYPLDQEIYNTDSQVQLDNRYENIPSPTDPLKGNKLKNNLEQISQYLPSQEENKEPRIFEIETRKEEMQEGDELKDFFSSMYLSTRNLPPYEQLRIKRILFSAVTEAQERIISSSGSHVTFVPYSAETKQTIISQGTYVSPGQQSDGAKNPALGIHNINPGQNQDTLEFLNFKVEN